MVQKNSIENPKILIVCGPTASGKTDLAVELAKLLDSEVISADSMYIYKGLNIGTAKPTLEEMQGVKHHLIDIIEPDENFSVSDYKLKAEPIISDLISKGKIPIICGGTGFYINSILYDLSYGNGECNLEVRNKYMKMALEKGNQAVFDILTKVDKETAKKLHPNDIKRVIRALEIYENGTKKSDIVDELKPKYDYKAFSINHDREVLYDRINRRVDLMIDKGLLDEVKKVFDNGINSSHQSMQAIGYKEFFEYFNGESSLEEVKEKIKLSSRHYAKRQITFFKRLENLILLQPSSAKELAQKIVKDYYNDWH